MPYVGCLRPGLIGPVIAMISLTGCATVVSDHHACPPVVEYSAAQQERAVAEVEALPPGAMIEVMLADYHVMRQQARGCA